MPPLRRTVLVLVALLSAPLVLVAGSVTGLVSFSNGTVANAEDVNANFAAVKDAVDGNATDLAALQAQMNQQLCELKGGLWNAAAGTCTEYVRLSTGTSTYLNADNLCASEAGTHGELCSWVELIKFLHPNHPAIPTVSATRFVDGWVGNYGAAGVGTFASGAWGGGDVAGCSNLVYRARVKAATGGDWERTGLGCATGSAALPAWCCFSNGSQRD